MYVNTELNEINQLLKNLKKDFNALVLVSFQKDTINELLEEGVAVSKEDFDLDQVSIKYSDGINDVLKRINGEFDNQHMAQSLVVLYIPYEETASVFQLFNFDEENTEEDDEEASIKHEIPDKYIYAYIDLVDLSIRYNDNCIAFTNISSL